MDDNSVRMQSEAAYRQWAPQWRRHAIINKKYDMKNFADFEHSGTGRAVLCIANGYTLEENIETIRQYQGNVDILACDKTMGSLLDHGIVPKFVMVCDANVSYEKYMKPWENQLQDTILLSNVCGSLEWPANGNWKDKYFFVNKDILGTEKEFMKLSGCTNGIAAGTNVSNAMVIMLTQCDDKGRNNFFHYDKILLIGYDYSWRFGKGYYAFDHDGGGKHQYMRHQYIRTTSGEYAYTSNNLAFSAQWFEKYVKTYNLPVIQCSNSTPLSLKVGDLAEQMQYRFKTTDARRMRTSMRQLRHLESVKRNLLLEIRAIEKDHFNSFMASV